MINERNSTHHNVFMQNSNAETFLCNVLITCDVVNMEPENGVVSCNCVLAAYQATSAGTLNSDECTYAYNQEFLHLFNERFTTRRFAEQGDITKIVIPPNLNYTQYGMLVAKRVIHLRNGIEERIVSFGGSLGYKFPSSFVQFFKAALDHVFLHSDTCSTMSRNTYMIHH